MVDHRTTPAEAKTKLSTKICRAADFDLRMPSVDHDLNPDSWVSGVRKKPRQLSREPQLIERFENIEG